METKKDIGSAVKQKLASFKASPDDLVWNNIESHLKKKRKRKGLILWFSGLGALALLLLVWQNNAYQNAKKISAPNLEVEIADTPNTSITNKSNSETLQKNTKNDTNQISEQSITKPQLVNKSNTSTVSKYVRSTPQDPKVTGSNTADKNGALNNTSTVVLDITNTLNSEEISNTKTPLTTKNEYISADGTKLEENAKDAVNEKQNSKKVIHQEKTKDSIATDNQSRWSITPQLIPTYYGALNKKTSNNFSVNYGILASYKMNEKLYFRVGVKKLDLNQDFMEVTQQLSYLQFPIDVKYIPFKNKLNPYFTGGFSLFSLEDINLNSAIEDYQSTAAVNLGVGLEKKIFSKLLINLESNFNYQLMPFSDNAKIKPYIITLNVGLEYRF